MDGFIRPRKRPTTEARKINISRNPEPVATAVVEAPEPVAETAVETPPKPVEEKPTSGVKNDPHKTPEKKKWFHKIWPYFKRENLTTKKKILLLACLVLLIGGAVYGGLYLRNRYSKLHLPASAPYVKPAPKPKPTTEPSHLTGLTVPIEMNKRPVTGIMIENSPDARPQSGLKDAGVVFEAIAEGGITRFLTLFQEAQPDYIGPVRSVRPYYIDWAMSFDAAIAHVGGSPIGLADMKAWGAKDLDQFANAGAYWRISQRYAPHNMYTSMAKLDQLSQSKGYTGSSFTGFSRKKDAPSTAPTAKTIDLSVSAFLYSPHYDYDPATNTYKRSEGGKPHVDEKSGAQLAPNVVIALIIGRGIDPDGQHTDYTTIGSGALYVFQDGNVAQGNWSKSDHKAPLVLTDSNGSPLKLNAGQTWITMVDSASAISYKP